MVNQIYLVTGMTCSACQANIERTVGKLDGVKEAKVSLLASTMKVTIDETKISSKDIVAAVEKIGYGAKLDYSSDGGGGRKKPQKSSENDEKTSKNRKNSKNDDKIADSTVGKNDFKSRFDSIKDIQKKQCDELKRRVILSLVFLLPLMYFSMATMLGTPNLYFFEGMENIMVYSLALLLVTSIIIFINRQLIINGIKSLVHLVPNMDSLVAVGSLASYIYGIAVCFIFAYGLGNNNHELVMKFMDSLYFESSATILTLVSLGKFFELKSRLKTSNALEKLVNLSPKTAKVLRDSKEVTIDSKDIAVGDIVIIKTGDIIPADGVIVSGEALFDQSAITGESMPVRLTVSDKVISASICTNGSCTFEAKRVGEDTTLAEVVKLVESASTSKAPIARIADKVSGYFVPFVFLVAIMTFFVWFVIQRDIGFALTFAVSVLVISCPCALGLATPVAIMVAMGKSASLGIMIKSAESLEILHKVTTIVFDKTGTLTEGKPTVTDIVPIKDGFKSDEILRDLASLEVKSNHPLAKAIVEKALILSPRAEFEKISNFSEYAGKGVCGKIKSKMYYAGNFEYIKKNVDIGAESAAKVEEKLDEFAKCGKMVVVFASETEVLAIVAIADSVKSDSKYVIDALKKFKIKVIMLTGDNMSVASSISKELGIDTVIAGVLPKDKNKKIEELKKSGEVVAMVGDGINDSPALMLSDVGIAMGTGTDIAADSSDVILTSGSLDGVVKAIELSKATIRDIKLNLFWAFFYNILGIPLACGAFYPLFGWQLSPMIASLAMSISSVCVVLSALSLNLFKPKFDIKKLNNIEESEEKKLQNLSENNKIYVKNNDLKENIMQKTIYISGMSCAHCKANVENALKKVPGVKSAEVNLEGKFAIVEMKASVTEVSLVAAVEDAGYKVTDIK